MKKYIFNLWVFLKKPFTDNLAFLVAILMLMVTFDIVKWLDRGHIKYLIYILTWDISTSYVLTLALNFCNQKKMVRRLYKTIVFTIVGFLFLADFCYLRIWEGGNYFEVPVIVQNTNFNESSEFLSSLCSLSNFIWIFGVSALIIIVYRYLLKHNIRNNKIVAIIASFIGICCGISIYNSAAADEAFVGKFRYWVVAFTRKTPNFREYYSNPNLEISDNLPYNIVVIVGESFSKYHSSLYGYEKETNPFLSDISNQNLFLFQKVESPALSTLYCFQEFMNDHHPGDDLRKWEESLTIHEVFSLAGYHISWVSNQQRVGFLDNVITAYADLSDDVVFCNELKEFDFTTDCDARVLPVLDSIMSKNSYPLNMYWIHLIGSHHDYKSRYPDEYRYFNEQDYFNRPENQRSNLSYYDNSIRYNDYVVNEIFERFKNKDALVIYFSDHGLDFYYTDPDYAYYGKSKIHESARIASQIPFMVYLSDVYNDKHPEVARRLELSLSNEFNTSNLIYFLMDIAGVKFSDNNDVRRYSPLAAW